MFFGVILIVVGLVFLLRNLGLITGDIWNIVWPLLLIAIGLDCVFRKRNRHWEKWHKFGEKMHKVGEEMHQEFSKDKE